MIERRTRLASMLRASMSARALLLPRRYRIARAADTWSRSQIFRWLIASREYTNFTYELTPSNQSELHSFVARVVGSDPRLVSKTIAELLEDDELTRHIADETRRSSFRHISDPTARYARRAGWYAFVRLTKPRLVVETGVDKGLGACVLASALLRNANEGAPGDYLGLDNDPEAGWLVSGSYADVATVRCGDSTSLLAELGQTVDMFIHDSDHSPAYERAEYLTVASKLSDRAIVLSDNAHATGELRDFALRTGRRFDLWREKPEHWYPGAGIGVAWYEESP